MPKPPSTALTHRPSFDLFESAANALIDAKRSPHTQRAYRADLQRWLAYCGESGTNPHQPSIMATTVFRDHLVVSLAEGSARRVIASLSSLYRLLLAGRVASANPFHPSLLAWPTTKMTVKTAVVSDEVALAMIAHAEKDRTSAGARDTAILRLLYDTGLRRESVATLLREDYVPPVLRAVVKGRKAAEIELPASTVLALTRWLRVAPNAPYIFPSEHGYINVATINKLVTQRAKAVGAKHVHPHRFRAAFATAGYDAELPEYEIQAGMHHQDPKTTRGYDRGTRGSSTATKIAKFRGQK